MLIQTPDLLALLDDGEVCVVDCRFNLVEPDQGRSQWLSGHIPGAVHADLDKDLAGPTGPGTGRHPLPEPDAFAGFLSRAGWSLGKPIVAYDAQGGAFAARLWWLMRYFGHDVVQLLDGGFPAWVAAGYDLETGETTPAATPRPTLTGDDSQVLDAAAVQAGLSDGTVTLVDARDASRFAGQNETIDPVAGHVPGAVNRPFSRNLDKAGRFHSPAILSGAFNALRGDAPPGDLVHMCGSGITACHNLFAMALAGQKESRLYAGSWSEWIQDSDRPVAGES